MPSGQRRVATTSTIVAARSTTALGKRKAAAAPAQPPAHKELEADSKAKGASDKAAETDDAGAEEASGQASAFTQLTEAEIASALKDYTWRRTMNRRRPERATAGGVDEVHSQRQVR